jgi:hypothetical protein
MTNDECRALTLFATGRTRRGELPLPVRPRDELAVASFPYFPLPKTATLLTNEG